jgi:hypothetical protein
MAGSLRRWGQLAPVVACVRSGAAALDGGQDAEPATPADRGRITAFLAIPSLQRPRLLMPLLQK